MTVRTIDTSLNRTLTLDSWSRNLTSISNQFIRFFFTNCEVNSLNPSFVSICQRILWQGVCLRWIVRYHAWFSCSDFDNLRYWSQGFFIRKFLAVDNLTIGTVNTSLDGPLTLDSWSCDLTTSFWNLICILLVNRKINLFYSNLIICSQFQLRILMNRSCIRTGAILCQF